MKKISALQHVSTALDHTPNERGTGMGDRAMFGHARLLLAAVLAVLSVPSDASASEHRSDASDCSLVEPIAELARDGDLIFRRGLSLESGLVLQLDRLGYSHVGLVRETPQGPVVIHSLPQDDEGRGGRVEQSPLGDFLAPARAEAAALYRVTEGIRDKGAVVPDLAAVAVVRAAVADDIHENAALGAVRWADERVRRRTPFDYSLDPTSSAALYCTELIWAAYHAAGVNLLPDFVPRRSIIRDRPSSILRRLARGEGDSGVILPSDLAESPHMRRLAEIDRREHPACR